MSEPGKDARPLGQVELKAWVGEAGGEVRFHHLEAETPTVAAAAAALGVRPEQVIKSLVFWVEEPARTVEDGRAGDRRPGRPVLVIGCGLDRVNVGGVARSLGTSKKAIRLATPDLALALTGYATGTMPPFGHRQRLATLIDRRVMHEPLVYGGCGDHQDMLSCVPAELLRLTGGQVADLSGD